MEKKIQKKDKYKLLEPVLYPELRKKIVPLDVDEDKYNDIGLITLNLLHKNEISIYKLLYKREANSDFNSSNSKTIRSEYLKKLVSTNQEYFPHELTQDKFKRRADVSYEEKLKTKILSMKDKAKTEKIDKRNSNQDANKRASNVERRESVDFIEKVVKEKKSKPNEDNVIVQEGASDAEEQNEEQSYEDEDFLMQSDEDGGSNSEEANYSEGGD
jgi:hypothetical protein